MKGRIGVDLDGTLAEYHGWTDHREIGKPIPKMVERVRAWIAAGYEVVIVTARLNSAGGGQERLEISHAIGRWLQEHGLPYMHATSEKDYAMIEIWDDRAVKVEFNSGRAVPDHLELLDAIEMTCMEGLEVEGENATVRAIATMIETARRKSCPRS